jgi:Protein of unknown function (Hypoth_ymh)
MPPTPAGGLPSRVDLQVTLRRADRGRYGPRMDAVWIRERLENYRRLCQEYAAAKAAQPKDPWATADPTEAARLREEILTELPTVKQIVEHVAPSFSGEIRRPDVAGGTTYSVDAATQVLGIIRDRSEWATRLVPDAPTLVADQMHATIWTAAATVWSTGEFKVGVEQAASSLSAHIKQRAGSHLTERELVQQVFSPDPPKVGQTRLHFPGDRNEKTWQSRQQGLHLIAQGAFAGIRNVAAHDTTEWTQQVALENLAVLSIVARWAEETQVVRPAQS